jgi:hypothetical protein
MEVEDTNPAAYVDPEQEAVDTAQTVMEMAERNQPCPFQDSCSWAADQQRCRLEEAVGVEEAMGHCSLVVEEVGQA